MASRYEEAVEAKLQALDYLRTDQGRSEMLWMVKDMGMDLDNPRDLDNGRTFAGVAAKTLEVADCYYWTEEVLETLEAAAPSLDSVAVYSEDVPTPAGFMYFPRPIDAGAGKKSWAVSWIAYRVIKTIDPGGPGRPPKYNFVVGPSDEALGLAFICWTRPYKDSSVLFPVSYMLHAFGTDLEEARQLTRDTASPVLNEEELAELIEFTEVSMKLVCAAFIFLKQPAFSIRDEPLPRAARRRIERRKSESKPSNVQVVYLRRPRVEPQGEGASVQWKSRWWVRVHFRTYRDAEGKVLRRRLILPYTKGPAGLPLKPPSEKVFAVIR